MSFGLEIKLNQASFSFMGVRKSAVLASWGSITGTVTGPTKGSIIEYTTESIRAYILAQHLTSCATAILFFTL